MEESYNGLKRRKPILEFSCAAEEYLAAKKLRIQKSSWQIESYNVRHLLQTFKGQLLSDITAAQIARYQQQQLSDGKCARRVNLDVGTLRGILRRNHLWEDLKIDVRMLPDTSRHGRALSPQEEEALLNACKVSGSRSLYPAVCLTLCTGLRLQELRTLTWDRIDMRTMHLVVGDSKTDAGSHRGIPLNSRAQVAITDWADQFPDRLPSHYVFLTEQGCAFNREGRRCFHHQDPTKPIGSWKTAWNSAKKKAGVSVRFHDIRHTVTTRMLENGIPRAVISSLLGWSASTEILMMKRYGHIGNEAFIKAVEVL